MLIALHPAIFVVREEIFIFLLTDQKASLSHGTQDTSVEGNASLRWTEWRVICTFLPNAVIWWPCQFGLTSVEDRDHQLSIPLPSSSNMQLMYWWSCEWDLWTVTFLLTMSLCLLDLHSLATLYEILYKSSQDENKLALWGGWRNRTFLLRLLRERPI